MNSLSPQPVRLVDYRPYPWSVERVELRFELDRDNTRVTSALELRRRDEPDAAAALELDGVDLSLERISVNGEALSESSFVLDGEKLVIEGLPAHCRLTTEGVIHPAANQGDEGLFELGKHLATQCESEGFRRLTWFPDRPDVLSRYEVTLVGDPEVYPVMLSNGHPQAQGVLEDGRHWIRWIDPFLKPSYIFAIVAGDFACLRDRFVTGSGRSIELGIYADHQRIAECDFAMGALKRSLAWEEQKYDREYDLDVYNIVALTGHVGAMENKGLNIFDANGICADPEISTDADYLIVERILAHEVFHNWSGNRVTCRDWFQLSLKEGLTRFRDQCFSQDMSAAGLKRIQFVKALQRNQFPEDDGPAAHAVKPDQYIEIRNFYTATVYDKGAEVIRMLHCLLGDELFREAVKQYLERYDQQAVTTEDFIGTVAEVSGRDLSQFYRWYQQPGRPRVQASGVYDPTAQTYTLTLRQRVVNPGVTGESAPLHIPVLMGLLSRDGEPLNCTCDTAREVDGNQLLELVETEQQFRFANVPGEPVPSLLRGFSAPVSLESSADPKELALLWAHDTDPFNRWQSGQTLAIELIRAMAGDWHRGDGLQVSEEYAEAWSRQLRDEQTDPGLLAELLLLPDEPALSEGLPRIDIDGHMAARDFLLRGLAGRNREQLISRYRALADEGPYQFTAAAIARRSLRNRCLETLLSVADEEILGICLDQVRHGGNMTDMFAALAALCHVDCPQREQGLEEFYRRWQHKDSVIDKWFNAQALSRMPNAIDAILQLEQHPAMDLMNMPRAMAFYGGFFRQNRIAFNSADGRGYDMLADRVIMVDSVKPGTTFWLMPQLLQWSRFDKARQQKMRAALEKVQAADISRGLYETVSKALVEEAP